MNISSASINTHQNWLNNSAVNVANAANRQSGNLESTITSQASGAPQLDTRVSPQPPELTREMTDQIIIPNAAEANADAIRTQDGMLGTLLDLKA